jgi:hypothetical protein
VSGGRDALKVPRGRRPAGSIEIPVLPLDVEVEGCVATLLEVQKLEGLPKPYLAAVQVRCGNVASNVFHVTYASGSELATRLRAEVQKFQYVLWLLGEREAVQRGLARPL